SLDLAELALDLSARILKPGGGALIKVFQGAGVRELVQSARGRFARVPIGSLALAELALDLSARILKPGGGALIKVFQGAGFRELVQSARGRFARVRVGKPMASRSRSPEMYLLAMQFRL